MEIQRLIPDQGQRLRAIRLNSLRDAPDAFGSTLAETAARPIDSWRQQLIELATFVAVVDGADLGIVRAAPADGNPQAGFLISMWVAPAARGKGVGDALIDAVVGWARSQGLAQLLLDVGDDNGPAIALYARKGFEPNGKTSSLPAPREHIREHQRVLELEQVSRREHS